MARPRRRPVETPYQRRIRRYLESHPGATRQQARGHRLPEGVRSEYARRTAGLEGEARRAAGGHRGYKDLLKALRAGDLVAIDPSSTRAPDGRWTTVRITVLDEKGRERMFTLRKVTDERVQALTSRITAVGAISSPSYPVGRLQHESEGPDEDEEEAA